MVSTGCSRKLTNYRNLHLRLKMYSILANGIKKKKSHLNWQLASYAEAKSLTETMS